ncbi:hypothetical protein [Spirosoma endophyticum]|uniref:Uncharacterized protein n=1 Tax=Spirosoma endophyticum TaxID=662367 RepID=A0A1I2EA22_9BACT|nr:hypothetical protein [Spirosoma endophyticum]SFE89328.1 hypothetical protein SAMN05216167_12170 [Spirosoma endophyticum]
MDQLYDEFEALGRFVRLIKIYRQTALDFLTNDQESLEAYLNQHLSGPDWQLWKRLQGDQTGERVTNEDVSLAQPINGLSFKLLFNQYKRAGYEQYTRWIQSLPTSCDCTAPKTGSPNE